MADQNLTELFRRNERLVSLACHVIVALMLACMVASFVQLGEYLLPQWNGSYLVMVCFLVALEAMYSWRSLEHEAYFGRERLLYRVAEWVVILFSLKLLIYAMNGFSQLWVDLPAWRKDLIGNFFNGEYLVSLFVIVVVWLLAGIFAQELRELEGDEKVLKLERESGISEERPAVRSHLVNLVFLLGGGMIFLAAFSRLDWEALWGSRAPLEGEVYNILIFFILALILFSLTEFSILRVHWGLERIPIPGDLARRWVVYSLFFLLLVGLVAAVLPTHYSLGLLDVLRIVFSLIVTVLVVVLLVLLTPVFLLFVLIAALLGKSIPLKAPPLPPLILPPNAPTAGQGWGELLKSILFWLLFCGLIVYSVYHYLHQNHELMDAIRKAPFLAGIWQGWQRLRMWIRGASQNMTEAVNQGWNRLRLRFGSNVVLQPWKYINIRRLSPRQQVLFYYQAMVRRGKEHGLPRHPAATPYEYAQELQAHLPEVGEEVGAMTEQFMEARYSRHSITSKEAGLVQRVWERIRQALRKTLNRPRT